MLHGNERFLVAFLLLHDLCVSFLHLLFMVNFKLITLSLLDVPYKLLEQHGRSHSCS
jgi:hypothetical protein